MGRPNGRNIALLSECVKRLECDGYEFMMYSTWYDQLENIERFMAGFPAPVPVFHCEKGIGECISRNEEGDTESALRLFEINCRLAKRIGAKTLVLHLWSGIHSDKDISHNISVYAMLREISDRYGLILTVENVVCNHADPMTHLSSLLAAYPDISFTFDTKMAQFHAQLPLLYGAGSADVVRHIRHMHINDYSGRYKEWARLRTLHMGEGQVDFDRLFAFVRQVGYPGDFTVEATSFGSDGIIDFDALNRDFARIRAYLR